MTVTFFIFAPYTILVQIYGKVEVKFSYNEVVGHSSKGVVMEKVLVRGHNVYFENNGCNVEDWLKQGLLFGESNYNLLSQLINTDGWIVDAGAHIGTFSFVPAFEGKKVIAIEGCHKNVVCLQHTFKGTKVEVHEAILAEKEKRCRFSAETGPFGWLIDDPEGDCVTSTLDAIIAGRPVSGLKLDIEGGEIAAIDGAKETLAQSKPPIVMEVNGYCLMQHQHRSEDLLKKIEENGYAIYVQMQNQIFRVDTSKLFPFCNVDVICIHLDNLDRYKFTQVRSLEEYEIEFVATEMCRLSNDDCKSYFKMIGVEV